MKIFIYWLSLAVAITLLSGIIYLSVKQDLRMSANDPQIQLAEDASFAIREGASLNSFISYLPVDISESLSPFLIIYDENGEPIYSGAVIDGKTPIPPKGVFDFVRKNEENRFTWQLTDGVRIAAVITGYNTNNSSGFILSGRSLREVERRENQLLLLVATGWIFSLITTFIVCFFVEKFHNA